MSESIIKFKASHRHLAWFRKQKYSITPGQHSKLVNTSPKPHRVQMGGLPAIEDALQYPRPSPQREFTASSPANVIVSYSVLRFKKEWCSKCGAQFVLRGKCRWLEHRAETSTLYHLGWMSKSVQGKDVTSDFVFEISYISWTIRYNKWSLEAPDQCFCTKNLKKPLLGNFDPIHISLHSKITYFPGWPGRCFGWNIDTGADQGGSQQRNKRTSKVRSTMNV